MASSSCLQKDDSNTKFVLCTDRAQWKPNRPLKNRIPKVASYGNEVEPYCEYSRTCICVTFAKMDLLLLCGFLFLILRFNFRTGSSCKGEARWENILQSSKDVKSNCSLLDGLGRYCHAMDTAAFLTPGPWNGLCSALGRPQKPIDRNTALALLSHLTVAFWSKRLTKHGLRAESQNSWLHNWHCSALIQNKWQIFASLFLHLQNRGRAPEAWELGNV